MFGLPGQSRRRMLERHYDEQRERAVLATLRGDRPGALRHSQAALDASRELRATGPNSVRYQAWLAAALGAHAANLRRASQVSQALALLAESARHYRDLARRYPVEFSIRAIDVQVKTGAALRCAGDRAGAVERLRTAIRQYATGPASDLVERDLGLAKAHFYLGRTLLELGSADEALAEIDAGLLIGERARQRAGLTEIADFSWLAAAPRSFQLAAPDWAAAAMCAMRLHDQAGRPDAAARAATIAVRVSGGVAAMGGLTHLTQYQLILAGARPIWERAQNAVPGG